MVAQFGVVAAIPQGGIATWRRPDKRFKFYATIPPEPILDATYNAGRFWKGSRRKVISMDIDPPYNPAIVGDNRKMTGVPFAKFGVVVYDPPHVGPQGRDKSKKQS